MAIKPGPSEPLLPNRRVVARQTSTKRTYYIRAAAVILLLFLALCTFIIAPWHLTKMPSNESNGPIHKHCPVTSHRHEVFDFDDPKSFSLLQDFDRHAAGSCSLNIVHGTISLRAGTNHQDSAFHIEVSLGASSESITREARMRKSDEEFQITFPARTNPDSHRNRCCLTFDVDVFVRPGTELVNLVLDTTIAQVLIKEGVRLNVTDKTTISTNVGTIESEAFFESTNTRISSNAGAVLGKYSIRDALDVHVDSGTVTAQIEPNSSTPKTDKPCILNITSHSGVVDVEYPRIGSGHLQERPYHTHISTNAGTIRGRYLVGAETVITTQAGIINADVVPYLVTDISTLITSSTTGNQTLRVVVPEKADIKAITSLVSRHDTTAGALDLVYPKEWEGSLYGETRVGWMSVEGKFDHIERGSKGFLGKWVKARRGRGGSTMEFKADVGVARLRVD